MFSAISSIQPIGKVVIAPTWLIMVASLPRHMEKVRFSTAKTCAAETMLCRSRIQSSPIGLLCNRISIDTHHPFTAPAVMPSTKYFCTRAKRMITGIVVMVPSAMMMPQSMCVELM